VNLDALWEAGQLDGRLAYVYAILDEISTAERAPRSA
jgi:hypothetical protein